MSNSDPSKVYLFDGSDPEIENAQAKARSTFRYFWREVHWEGRRIIPGLTIAAVKAPFSDGPGSAPSADHPSVEQMWISDVSFDGRHVRGVLLNDPNWLKSVKAGDEAQFAISEISDWMYAIGDDVYGAYTVNLMRSKMKAAERREHDAAWGLNFRDPNTIRIVPTYEKRGLFKSLFGKPEPVEIGEHPMSENMAPTIKDQVAQNPDFVNQRNDEGWTLLHQEALAGNLATVRALLEAGADRKAVTNDGRTPLHLAQTLGWEKVVALLGN